MRAGPAECNVATEEAIFASQWTGGSEDPSAQMDRFTHQPVAMGLSAEMGRTPLTHSAPDSLRTYTMFLSLLVQSVSGCSVSRRGLALRFFGLVPDGV